MTRDQSDRYFLLFCLAASLLLVYFIIRPFLSPLILAAVFAFLLQPVYLRLVRVFGGWKGSAALATTLIAIVLVLVPVVLLGTQIFKESSGLYQSLAAGDGHSLIESTDAIVERARTILPIPADAELNVSQYVQQGLQFLAANIGGVFSGVAKLLLSAFVFLMAFYFLLKDGWRLKEYLVALSPLKDSDDNMIVSRLEAAVSASIKGSLTIGLVQGILTGIGFSIFGIPNAVLWGSVAAVAALVPGIGTALVLLPGIAYLFLTGETMSAAGLLVWGVVGVGLIDNLLGPRLVGKGMRLHPLAVFLAVLGGLAFFGPLGFLLGPLAVSVCLAFIDIHFALQRRTSESA